jgi:hypothetical protein
MQVQRLDLRWPATAVALALALGPAACGGSGNDKQAVKDRVNTFDRALGGKDPKGVCASVSSTIKRRLTRTPSGGRGPTTCEAALRLQFLLAGNLFKNLAKTKVSQVQIDGDQAQATISYRGRKERLGLAKQDGDWLITTLRLRQP